MSQVSGSKGYYLYKDNFKFKVLAPNEVTLGKAELPKGKEKQDETFGKVEVFYKTVKILLPVSGAGDAAKPLKLKLVSQGCAEAGICYPPHGQEVSVTLPPVSAAPVPATLAPAASGSEGNSASADESGWIAAHLQGSGFWTNLFFFFVAGLGLALTPCVFPMIPILSGIIVGQGHQVSRGRAFALSLAYVLGMAVTYAAAAVAAGMTGTLLSAALQNVWVLGAFAMVFVVLSFSMFGFDELQLPTSLQRVFRRGRASSRWSRDRRVFHGRPVKSALVIEPEKPDLDIFDLPPDQLKKLVQGFIWRDEHFQGLTIRQIADREGLSDSHVGKQIFATFELDQVAD